MVIRPNPLKAYHVIKFEPMKKELSIFAFFCVIILSCSFRGTQPVKKPSDEAQIIDLYL